MTFPGQASILGVDNTEHVVDGERFYSKGGRWHRGPISKFCDAFKFNPANPGGSWARLGLVNAPARHVIRMTAAFEARGAYDVFLRLYDNNINMLSVEGATQRVGANYWGSGGLENPELKDNGLNNANGIPLNSIRTTAHLHNLTPFQTQIHMFKEANNWTGVRTSLYYFSDTSSPLQSEHYVSLDHDISAIYAVGIGVSTSGNFANMEIFAEYW